MRDYEVLKLIPINEKGKYLGTVVIIKNYYNDNIYVGKGKTDKEALENALEQRSLEN